MEVSIRRVQEGDEKDLAYIQTESWKAAFANILDVETLSRCTNIDKAIVMYQRLLKEKKGNGYILLVDRKPHCLSHIGMLPRRRIYRRQSWLLYTVCRITGAKVMAAKMMDKVLKDIKEAGYQETCCGYLRRTPAHELLWVKRIYTYRYYKTCFWYRRSAVFKIIRASE